MDRLVAFVMSPKLAPQMLQSAVMVLDEVNVLGIAQRINTVKAQWTASSPL